MGFHKNQMVSSLVIFDESKGAVLGGDCCCLGLGVFSVGCHALLQTLTNKYKEVFFYMLLAIHVPSSTLIFRFLEGRTWNESGVFPIILGHHIYIYIDIYIHYHTLFPPKPHELRIAITLGKCDFSRDTVVTKSVSPCNANLNYV
jgi:hypothetical protein